MIPNQYSIAQARDRFAQIIHDAENGKPVQIVRHGKPVAVVLSLGEYQRLTSDHIEFGVDLAKFRQKYQIQSLDIEPDEVFNNVRDRSSSREVSF
jgi:prevent-host-death family protein